MVKLDIKPLSLNHAYRGRRFATQELKDFKDTVSLILPKRTPLRGNLSVFYRFGVSSKGADVDNCIKVFQDALAETYGFNDNRIYRWVVEKVIVPKGQEFIMFEIDEL